MEKKTVLNQDTLMPIGAVTIIFGACIWLTSIWKQGEVNAAQIVEMKSENEKSIDRMYEKLTKIEDKIDLLMEKTKK